MLVNVNQGKGTKGVITGLGLGLMLLTWLLAFPAHSEGVVSCTTLGKSDCVNNEYSNCMGGFKTPLCEWTPDPSDPSDASKGKCGYSNFNEPQIPC